MAGTRLALHTTFVLELFALIVISLLYASTKTTPEGPFFIDRSGWKLVTEPVSPVDHGTNFDRLARATRHAWMKLDRLLLGNDALTKHIAEVRSPSAFVDEMKRAVSDVSSGTFSDGEFMRRFPPCEIRMSVPQMTLDSELHDLAKALERGLQRKHPLLSVSVAEGEAEHGLPTASVTSSSFCDEWTMPPSATEHRREIQKLQLIILTKCSSSIPPDTDRKAILQMSRDDPVLILRTSHNAVSPDDASYSQLHPLLEGDVASILSDILDASPSTPTHAPRKLTSLSLEIIDENPTLRSEYVDKNGSAKEELEYLGEMFDSLVNSLVHPLLRDLSFVYGGEGRPNVPVAVMTHLSAYLPLEEEMIESYPNKENGASTTKKYVSTEQTSTWVNKHWNRNPFITTRTTEQLQWVFYVPSPNHTPLMIRDESTGREGISITFSLPELAENETTDALVSGFSVVNLDHTAHRGIHGEISMQSPMQPFFENATAAALLHLIGYIRAFHGLSPVSSDHSIKSTPAVSVTCCIEPGPSATHRLSFWEMESIARNHWNSILEKVMDETDALMSLLHTHGTSLAFPEAVARALNNSTRLLRYSISLAQQGYPAVYSTSAMYDSLRYIESVRTHPELMEMPHFSLDHYLAVFSPLVLPLLMPMIVGLVREIKRFKKLRSKVT